MGCGYGFVVFLDPHRRETPKKRDKTEKSRENWKLALKVLSIILGEVFDMDFLQK
jgi:hypothetical protein